MVSSTLWPAVNILGSLNVYSMGKGIADHYWPWAVFFFLSPISLPFYFSLSLFASPRVFAGARLWSSWVALFSCFTHARVRSLARGRRTIDDGHALERENKKTNAKTFFSKTPRDIVRARYFRSSSQPYPQGQ